MPKLMRYFSHATNLLQRRQIFTLLSLFSLLLSAPLCADQIRLKNGDQLSGKILLIEAHQVEIETDYAGRVKIDAKHIAQFEIKAPVAVKENQFTKSFTSTEVLYDAENDALKDRLIIKNHGIPQSIPFDKSLIIAKVNRTTLQPKTFRQEFSLNASAIFDNDNSRLSRYRLKGEYTLEYRLWRHATSAHLYRKRDQSKTKDYYYHLNYSADRFITPRFFWQGSIDFQHDWIEDIRNNLLIGTGPGFQLWNNTRSQLSLATLLNYQHIEYRDHAHSRNPQLSLKWDFQHALYNQTITFSTKGSVGRSFNRDVTLDLNLNAKLAYRLTDNLSIDTGYQYEKLKAKRGSNTNRTLYLGFGLKWK